MKVTLFIYLCIFIRIYLCYIIDDFNKKKKNIEDVHCLLFVITTFIIGNNSIEICCLEFKFFIEYNIILINICKFSTYYFVNIIDVIDVVKDQLYGADYVREEDPKFYISEKTNRGPLNDSWLEYYWNNVNINISDT